MGYILVCQSLANGCEDQNFAFVFRNTSSFWYRINLL